MRFLALLFVLFNFCRLNAQKQISVKDIQADVQYDNILVKKISEDSLQSVFLIWVKRDVKEHFHREHSENIIVLRGRAEMLINDSVIKIRKGDFISIPKGTMHSVRKVLSKCPLKVMSIQSPLFDGTDRVFIEEKD